MAEVTAFRNNALPYPVYGAPWVIVFPLLDADGDPVTGATCDSEVAKNGDTGVDCTNEGVEIPYTTATNKGMYYLILTAAEMTADIVAVTIYSATSKATAIVLYPRKLVALRSGTAQGGAAGYITLDASAGARDDRWNGCLCVATIDTLVEARIIADYTGSNQQAAVTPGWNVTPDADDTFILYLPEGMQLPTVNVGHVAETVQTAGDLAVMLATIDDYVDTEVAAILAAVVTELADLIATVGAAGAGLTALGDVRLANLDAAVSTRALEAGGNLATLLGRIVGTLLTGNHNPQSGDAYAKVNDVASGNAALKTLLDTIAGYTDDIGALGAGLTAIPNSAGVATLLGRIVGTLLAGNHNPQSGDAYGIVNDGTIGNAAIKTLEASIAAYIDTEIGTLLTNVAAILADTGTDGVVLSTAMLNKIADHVLRRAAANARASADGDAVSFRSLLGAVSKLVNKVAPNGANLEVFDETDAGTPVGVQAMTTDAAAEPIISLDTV